MSLNVQISCPRVSYVFTLFTNLQNINITVLFMTESNCCIVTIAGYASSTSEDVNSSHWKGFESGSTKISNYDRSISCPVQQGCPSFRRWIESSCDASTGRFNAQHVMKDFLITSVGNSTQASIIHCKTVLLRSAFKFPAAVSSCIPIVPSYSSYFSVQEALNGLFQVTSGAWMYLVQPPGTITRSTFFAFSDSLALSSIWHS